MKVKSKLKTKKIEQFFSAPEIVNDDSQSDNEEAAEGHDSLVKNLIKNSKLQTDFRWQSKRTEAKTKIDEFGISKDEKTRVSLNKLLKVSKNSEGKKKLRTFEQKAVTAAPLKTPLAKKAARKANYLAVSQDVTKYDSIVKEIRRTDQIVFPLQEETLKFNVSDQLGISTSKHEKPKPVSSLEKEIETYIQGNSSNIETDTRPFTENELAILKAKSVEEARAIHREIQKRRLLISFQESKYRRMRKIKSKSYHRLLKKDKLKKTVQDFDKLIEESPDKALEKLEELNKLRALERASLKHRNTGKWAKHQKLRAKYDENARNEMNSQLQINSEMMKKRSLALLDRDDSQNESEDDEESEEEQKREEKVLKEQIEQEIQETLSSNVNTYNPWISAEKNSKKKKFAQTNNELNLDDKIVNDFLRNEIEKRVRKEKEDERARLREIDSLDERNIDETDGDKVFESSIFEQQISDKEQNKSGKQADEEEFGHQFNEFDFHNNEFLKEAFIDDDVVEEFYKEQEEQAKKDEEERMNKKRKIEILPGWGEWAGAGINEDQNKKSKFIQRELKKQKKIDTRISNAIILKSIDSLGSKFKIPQRPGSNYNAKMIEQNCLKPIGSTWNPQMVTKCMTEPAVIAPLGRIIPPMDSKAMEKFEL